MQLILKPENTADVKTKMSLNDEKFEKCITDIVSIARNGDISNGDLSSKNNEAGDSIKGGKSKVMLETNKPELKTANCELEQVENDNKNSRADMETPKNKDLDQADTINNINNEETDKNEILSNNDKNNEILAGNRNSEEEEDTSLILSDSDIRICDNGNKIHINACERLVVKDVSSENEKSVNTNSERAVVEEKYPENKNSEYGCESINEEISSENANRRLTENEKCLSNNDEKAHMELGIFDRDTEICNKPEKSANAIQSFVVEQQNETGIDKKAVEVCNDNATEDASLEISDEMVHMEPVNKEPETELNDLDDPMEDDIIITMDSNTIVDDIIKNNLIDIGGTTHIKQSGFENIEKTNTTGSSENDPMEDDNIITLDGIGSVDDIIEHKLIDIDGTAHISQCENENIEKQHTASSNEDDLMEDDIIIAVDGKGTVDDIIKHKLIDIGGTTHINKCGVENIEKDNTTDNNEDDPMEDVNIITLDGKGTVDDIIKDKMINIDGTAHISQCENENIRKEHTASSNEDDLMEDDIIITMDGKCTDDDIIKLNMIDIDSNIHISECEDRTVEKENNAGIHENLSNDKQLMTDCDRIVDCPEDETKTKTCDKTDEKQNANQIKNTENDTANISVCGDETIIKKHTACNKEKISNDKQKMTDSDGIIDCLEDVMKTKSCEKTNENVTQIKHTESKSDHTDHVITNNIDMSEDSTSLDFKNGTVKNGSVDESLCLHKSTVITDPVENITQSDGNCVTETLEHFMNVDDTEANISEKEETEINLSMSPVNSPSNFNGSADHTITVDCSINEPAATQKINTVALLPDTNDDVIFNVDDDNKEESLKLSHVNEVESTEIIVKNNCNTDSDQAAEKIIGPEAKVPDSSEDIIDLDETGSKCIISDLRTLDQDSEKLHKSSMEKTPKVLNPPPLNSDDFVDLNETVTKPTTSESITCNVNHNEWQDATEKISGVVSPVLKLSNTLDILSDEEEGPKETNVNNKCINIEDDDDIMLIDDDTSGNESKTDEIKEKENESEKKVELQLPSPVKNIELSEGVEQDKLENDPKKPEDSAEKEDETSIQTPKIDDNVEPKTDCEIKKPLLQEKFLKTCKKNLADMTREELEEFCVLKIVESILDRSNLSEIRTKLKSMAQNIDEYKKKAMVLEKHTRDLQLVLKSVQDEQEKGSESITPLKITRSVGMQVMLGFADKSMTRRKSTAPTPANKPRNAVPQGPRPQKPATPQKQSSPQIPVPRLVPANNPTLKSPTAQPTNPGKVASPVPNGIKAPSPAQKAEKRSHNRIQSVTVDLTDDEPPAKVVNRAVPVVPPVRLVPSQNLLASPRQQVVNSSPRKVYIPISGPQGQNVRPGQTIMLKTVPSQGTRQRCPPPHMVRMPQTMRMPRPQAMRHPAPLPDCVKQYQPPNWKALPPAPDLKLAKVENGIVISWKIEGYQEDSYEEIASYQLYAYQETSSPPNTALWKKIGDVKALPLPMACTLTQFMAGYKYYFAVRALDIRSRLGPFSLPGSILLLNKM